MNVMIGIIMKMKGVKNQLYYKVKIDIFLKEVIKNCLFQ